MHLSFDCLLPTTHELLARVHGDLRMGLPCQINDGATRAVMIAVETIADDRFDALRDRFGAPELVLTSNRAQAVMTPAAAADLPHGPVGIRPPDLASLDWFARLADPQRDATSGPIGPLHMLRGGATRLQELGIGLVKTAELLPAVAIFAVPAGENTPRDLQLTSLDAGAALQALRDPPALIPVAAAPLPLVAHDQGKLHIFRDPDGTKEHYALEIGTPDRSQPVLSRLHSACFTGDVLGSLKCDCGPQLRTALARMGEEGSGVLLYLNQEGRGIGLANKMRVYDLQAQGLDTVEANHRLGYDDDERDFRVAAVMLRALGFHAVRLLTNNPAKVQAFEDSQITITEQLPLRVGRNTYNQHYLAVKAQKSGHML